MKKNEEEYKRQKEICDCNNLLVELKESGKFVVKEGTVFDKETGKCLGTVYELYKKGNN